MTKRLMYLDYAKCIAIILVVLGHTLGESKFVIWLYSFHIPIFFIITGMQLSYKKRVTGTLKISILKLIRSLVVPYLIFSIVNILFDFMFKGLYTDKSQVNQMIYGFLAGWGNGATWFLIALFIAEVLIKYIFMVKNVIIRHIVVVALFFIAIIINNKFIILITLNRALIGAGFIYVGYYIDQLMNTDLIYWWAVIAINVINVCLAELNGRVDLCHLSFGNPILYILSSVLGSIGIILLCIKISSFKCKLISFIGRNSLIVQCTHTKLITIFSLFNCPSIIISLLVLSVELPVIYIWDKYLYFLLGRQTKIHNGSEKN